jgi:hypothetical protein
VVKGVEGSVDGKKWHAIDRRRESEEFKGVWTTTTFRASPDRLSWFSTKYRFIRLSQTGKNEGGNHHLALAAVEFYGKVKHKKDKKEKKEKKEMPVPSRGSSPGAAPEPDRASAKMSVFRPHFDVEDDDEELMMTWGGRKGGAKGGGAKEGGAAEKFRH